MKLTEQQQRERAWESARELRQKPKAALRSVDPQKTGRGGPAGMAFSLLSGDEQRSMFLRLYDALAPRVAVAFSSVNRDLRASTQALLPQLRANHEAATALCIKMGMGSC